MTTLSQVIQPLFYSDDPNLRRASHSNEQADRMMQGASILEATCVAKTEGHDTSYPGPTVSKRYTTLRDATRSV
ncbi:hypothetical protein [Corynebacterium camporealensis]